MTKQVLRSPLFYVGSKYRLMRQFFSLFPAEINNFYEPFVGGGTVFLNVTANKYFLNDVDKHLITVHKFLRSSAQNPKLFFAAVEKIICKYGLSCSYKHDIVPASLKAQYHKTYYAKFNKVGYERLRTRANKEKKSTRSSCTYCQYTGLIECFASTAPANLICRSAMLISIKMLSTRSTIILILCTAKKSSSHQMTLGSFLRNPIGNHVILFISTRRILLRQASTINCGVTKTRRTCWI